MTRVLSAILAGGALAAAATSARCDNLACPIAEPPKVDINITLGPERVKADMSLEQLRQAAKGHHSGPVVGAYIGSLAYGAEIDDTVRELASDRYCATP
jgi:hypothetical protein